jgi:hypothetical protein
MKAVKDLFIGQPAAWVAALVIGGGWCYYDYVQKNSVGSFGNADAAAWNKAIKQKAKDEKQ